MELLITLLLLGLASFKLNEILVEGVSLEKDLTITYTQKQILDKFKSIVEPALSHEYMKEEIYLIRWLRAQDFNIDAAKDMLYQNLQWRKDNQMDGILDEHFDGLEHKFRHPIIGYDKQGRPVILTDIGDFDLRSVLLTGKQRTLERYFDYSIEEVAVKIRKMQAEGQNVTQYYHIYDLDEFNLIQHGCPQCLSSLLNLLRTYQNYYPGLAHRVVMVNCPAIFETMFQTLVLAMKEETREKFALYGKNKKQWQPVLFKDIDQNQLPYELGGTKFLTEDDYVNN